MAYKMRHLKRFTVLIFLFFIYYAGAQKLGQAKIDSLIQALSLAKEDTNKVNILNDITYANSTINLEQGIKYGELAIALATKLDWQKGLANAYIRTAVNFTYKGDFSKALEYYNKGLSLFQLIGDKSEIASCYTNIGIVNLRQGNSPKSLEYFYKGLKIYEEIGDKDGEANNYNCIANVYSQLGKKDLVLATFNRVLKLYTEINNKQGIGMALSNISFSYYRSGKIDSSISYANKSIKVYEGTGDKRGLAGAYENLSVDYAAQKNYREEIKAIMSAYDLFKKLGSITNIADCQMRIGEFFSAIAGDTITNLIVDGERIPSGKTARLEKSEYYFRLALEGYKKTGASDIIKVLQGLSLTLEDIGNYKDALKYYKEYTRINDSVFSNENKIKIEKLETRRALDLKDKQIKIDGLEVEKKKNEKGFFMVGIALLLLIIGFVFRSYKTQKRTNKLLNIEKKRSDDLLLNILPAEVAEELKNKGSAEARLYDNVTVMFTDFVNFSKAGETMEPGQLIGELDTCFKAFDNILHKFDIEKIKTIGDAYLAVSGLPAANPNHAIDVAAAALEINGFMQNRRKELGDNTFDVRIGIHSGNVVAGIVGLKKFAYDIWGDTVNTAARMEQNSEPGRINISRISHTTWSKSNFIVLSGGNCLLKTKVTLACIFWKVEMFDRKRA